MEVLRVVEAKSKNRMPGIFKAGTLAISTLLKAEQLDSKDKNLDLDYANLKNLSGHDLNLAMDKFKKYMTLLSPYFSVSHEPLLEAAVKACVTLLTSMTLEVIEKDGITKFLRSDLEKKIPILNAMIWKLIEKYIT